jgi:hypothetical protein
MFGPAPKRNRLRRRRTLLRASGAMAGDGYAEAVIPTRWVKFVFGLFLLPVGWVWTQSFFAVFTRTAVHQRFWLTEEFWFFGLGAILWLIAFFGLPRPVMVYVFGHELTHAIWVWLMGGRVSRFRVSRDGGSIETDTNNFLISLAPYFFPIYSILLIVAYGAAGFFADLWPYRRLLFALLGITWCFHITFTLWMIPKGQSDLRQHGTFFSLTVIHLFNLAVLTVLLIIASPQVGWQTFARELLANAIDFSAWLCSMPLLPGR